MRGALLVREPLRFIARQLGPPRTGDYRLRDCDLRVSIRHENIVATSRRNEPPTGDVHILNEIFGRTGGRNAYEPPAAFAALLDSTPEPRVLDLGANIGLFGIYAQARWHDAHIESLEPDPSNMRVLRRVIAANALTDRWSALEAAAANRDGQMTFVAGLRADSHFAPPERGTDEDTIIVPAVDIFGEDLDVTLLKIDIEGGEWPVLTDPRFRDVPAAVIVLEWHARGCPDSDARAAALRLLRDAGYRRLEEVEVATNNGVVWAAREAPHA